jgi:hypothetical protein
MPGRVPRSSQRRRLRDGHWSEIAAALQNQLWERRFGYLRFLLEMPANGLRRKDLSVLPGQITGLGVDYFQ